MKSSHQTVGRPREFEESDVLDSVLELFWAQGYEATGLSDIMSKTGLAKGSIYKAFQSKHNLYLKSLERYEHVYVKAAVQALGAKGNPLERLDAFLSAPIRDTSDRGPNIGCFLCNASADRADIDSEVRALVKRGYKNLGQALTQVVSEIKPQWHNNQIEQSAHMLLSNYSGLRIMSRSGVDIKFLKSAKAGALLALKAA